MSHPLLCFGLTRNLKRLVLLVFNTNYSCVFKKGFIATSIIRLCAIYMSLPFAFLLLVQAVLASPAATAMDYSFINHLAASEFVFIGKVEKVKTGPTQLSYLPIHHVKISFIDKQFFKGGPKHHGIGDAEEYAYCARQNDPPTFEQETQYVVGGTVSEGLHVINYITPANDTELVQLVMILPNIPAGWIRTTTGWVSPFPKHDPEPKWYSDDRFKAKVKCADSKRPALLSAEGIELQVEQVTSGEKSLEFVAPFGDGEFTISVTNTNSEDVEVEALLSDSEGKISWEDSIILIDDEESKAYALPEAGKKNDLKPTLLKAGETRKVILNALTIKGSEHWRVGGIRVYLNFCLGDLCRTNFFYYSTSRHEEMHNTMIGSIAFKAAL